MKCSINIKDSEYQEKNKVYEVNYIDFKDVESKNNKFDDVPQLEDKKTLEWLKSVVYMGNLHVIDNNKLRIKTLEELKKEDNIKTFEDYKNKGKTNE